MRTSAPSATNSQIGGGPNSTNPAAIFVVTSLEKLLDLKEVKKHPKLKTSATSILAKIKDLLDSSTNNASNTRGQNVLTPDMLRNVFEPLQLACASRSASMIALALDCIAKLISYNVLVGSATPLDGGVADGSMPDLANPAAPSSSSASASISTANSIEQRSLIELAVDTVCECNMGEHTDEKVHLQVVKALLAAASSVTVPIHGNVLLKAIRTTWNIFLVSRSPQIQIVAQGSLTQMMTTVYSRASAISSSEHFSPASTSVTSMLLAAGISPSHISSSKSFTRPISTFSSPPSLIASEAPTPLHSPQPVVNGPLPPKLIPPEHPMLDVDLQSLPPLPVSPSPQSPSKPRSSSLSSSVSSREGASISRASSPRNPPVSPNNKMTSRVTSPAPIAESSSVPDLSSAPFLGKKDSVSFSKDPRSVTLAEMYTRDVYLTFRALCKLATKVEVGNATNDVRSTAVQSRVLALQLILLAMKSHVVVFAKPCYLPSTTSDFVESTLLDIVRTHLGLAIGRSLVSPIVQVYKVALDILVAMVLNFRWTMKREIEVFLADVVLNLLEMKAATPTQKVAILSAVTEILKRPQALVEIYINYDCNPEAMDNIFEHMLNSSAKLISAHLLPNMDPPAPGETTTVDDVHSAALGALCTGLKSMLEWTATCRPRYVGSEAPAIEFNSTVSASPSPTPALTHVESPSGESQKSLSHSSHDSNRTDLSASVADALQSSSMSGTLTRVGAGDDPDALVSRKQQKMVLNEAIQLFNKKPKRGIAFLVERKIIEPKDPGQVAQWLHSTEGLNKHELGEYLGDGDHEVIAVMHAFVDAIDFTGETFVTALRHFLQHFRLPGESQKIDRFMLKFAERYYMTNRDLAENVFTNPDTAYVLAYSVILLNTDLHNPQVKRRMTKDDFVRNNRGINDGSDLPSEYLHSIYDEIGANEIKLKDDPLAAAAAKAASSNTATVSVSRKARREAFALALEEINCKIEVAFEGIPRRSGRRYVEWITATHADHVRAMFEASWMGNLAALSTVLQKVEDPSQTTLILEAFKNCIIMACTFNLDLERNAFVTTLSNFTQLNNSAEMREKNISAIRTILEVAALQGNAFKNSWLDVLKCASQLEQFQVIAGETGGSGVQNSVLQQEGTSQAIVVATDRIFTGSAKLNGASIVDFVDALCTVSWDEIPRMYSLTKLVEISYYNMSRIRVEWVNLWSIVGQHFIRLGCHGEEQVAYFAMDSLRQMSMKFLEMDELSNFKFQREFLRPYEHVVANQTSSNVREMVIRCIQQMIQSRVSVLRSGWKAMLSVFLIIAKQETSQSLFTFAYEVVKSIMSQHLVAVRECGYYVDTQEVLVQFCKANLSQKVSLQAVEAIHRGIKVLADSDPDCKIDESEWFAALHALYTGVVDCELEVRTRALQYLFAALRDHGSKFSAAFWQRLGDEILFELFAPVTKPSAVPRGEDLNIWLSTTLIQALRQFIDLFSSFYGHLRHKLSDVLGLLQACILQDNETLSRLGTTCLQQLMESNCSNLTDADWDEICLTWRALFAETTATALMDPETTQIPQDEQQEKFQQIIVKCVLQLLLIQTILEVTSVDQVYSRLQSRHLLSFVDTLEESYQFARVFNGNVELRTTLWKSGFTKQLPNLLKQETSSVTCLLHILFHMYGDSFLDRISVASQVEEKLIPLAVGILETYRDMDAESRKRNITAWRPVLLTILNGLVLFNDDSFQRHIIRFYRLSIDLLMYEVSEDIRTSLHAVLIRTEQFIMSAS